MRSGYAVATLISFLLLAGQSPVLGQQASGNFRSSGGSSAWGSSPSATTAGHAGFSSAGSSWGKSQGAFSGGTWGTGHGMSVPAAPPVSSRTAARTTPVRPALRAAPTASNGNLGSTSLHTRSAGGAFAAGSSASGSSFGGSRVTAPGLNTSLGGSTVGSSSLSTSLGGSSLSH